MQQYSAAKEQSKTFYNRELSKRENNFINNPDLQFLDKSEDIITAEAKYDKEQQLKNEVTFGDIFESTNNQGQENIIGLKELMEDTLIKHQEKVKLS